MTSAYRARGCYLDDPNPSPLLATKGSTMILANLDQHLADAGYKRVFPDRAPIDGDLRTNPGPCPHLGLHVDRNVIESRPLPLINDTHCQECSVPIQSDDVNGRCSDCHGKELLMPRCFTVDTIHLSRRMYLNALSWDGKAWNGEGGSIYSPSENVRSWWGAEWHNDPLNAGYPVAG